MVRIEPNDVADGVVDSRAKSFELVAVERVADDNEPITMEDPHGPFDFVGVADFETADAVVGREVCAHIV